jgi:putative membrane protein
MKQSFGIMLGTLALVTSASGLALSQTVPPPTPPPMSITVKPMLSDADFVRAVQQSNDMELAAARYVLTVSKNAMVRAFANQIIADHSTSNVSLQSAARSAGVPVPGGMRVMMVGAPMQGMTGPSLDYAYMRQEVAAHAKALAIVTNESQAGASPALRLFASLQVPIVQHHLDVASNFIAMAPNRPTGGSVAPLTPGGGASPGNLIPPSTPGPSGTGSPNPQPSVGIPTLPSPGPSSTPH